MNCHICNTPVSSGSAIIIDHLPICSVCKPSAIHLLREQGTLSPEQIDRLPWKICAPMHLLPFALNATALVVVIPMGASLLYAVLGSELSTATRFILTISDLLRSNLTLTLGATIAACLLWMGLIRQYRHRLTKKAAAWWLWAPCIAQLLLLGFIGGSILLTISKAPI